MTLTDRALRWLYLLAGAYTTYAAVNSARAGGPTHAAGFLTVTALLVAAAVRDYLDADDRRAAAVRAERAARARALEDGRRMREDADRLAAHRGPLNPTHVLGTAAPGECCEHRGTHVGLTCAEVDQTLAFWEARWDRPADRLRCTCAGVGFGTGDCSVHHPGAAR